MRIGILAGGPGGESDISLVTADAVTSATRELGWVDFRVNFGRRGEASTWPDGTGTALAALAALEVWAPDHVFIAMHGAWGEDGRIQGALEVAGLTYQGSGVLSSALAMDKIRSKDVFRARGLPVAADLTLCGLSSSEACWDEVVAVAMNTLGLPFVLKTPGSGSSVGVAVVDTAQAAVEFLREFGPHNDAILAEAFIAGREFTCPVVDRLDGVPEPFPVIEIRPLTARFFDRQAKYDPGATDELCPAPIDAALERRLRELALAAHVALGCRTYSRTDFRVDHDGNPFVLETNTLPGLTPASLLPKSAAVAGLSFPQLIARLVLGSQGQAG